MDGLAELIGRNIDALRISKGITKTDLAVLLGVTRPTLDNYIKGKQIIDSGKLALLARKFNRSMDYFLSSTEEHGSYLMYRAERAIDTPIMIVDSIMHRFDLYADLLLNFKKEAVFVPPTYSIRLSGQQKLTESDKRMIEEVALKCRRALSLEGITGGDLFWAVEEAGINVLAFPTDPNAKVWGASAYSHESGSYVYVNDHDSIPEERKIFSLIHELGHLVLHRDLYWHDPEELKYMSKRKDINEQVADHFASSFLLPRARLEREISILGNDPSISNIFTLKRRYNVSFQAVVMALRSYGLLSKEAASKFFAFLNSRGYMDTEPKPLPYIEKNHQLTFCLQNLYERGEIGLNKVAEYLGLSLLEARKVVREWGVGG